MLLKKSQIVILSFISLWLLACAGKLKKTDTLQPLAPPPDKSLYIQNDIYFEDGKWKSRGKPIYEIKRFMEIFTRKYPKSYRCERVYTVPDYANQGTNKIIVEEVPVFETDTLEKELTEAFKEYLALVPYEIIVEDFSAIRGIYSVEAKMKVSIKNREYIFMSSGTFSSYAKMKNYVITEFANSIYNMVKVN